MGLDAPVEAFQNPWEFRQLLAIYRRLRPRRVLEIGSWKGGTLWYWLQERGATVVVVDDQARNSDEWARWSVRFGSSLICFRGMSQDSRIVASVAERRLYDFAFIDGDHTHEAVKADWDNYAPMVKPGGIIALHDILPRPGYGVSTLWQQIKDEPGRRWIEICHNEILPGNEGRCGIGVTWM